MKTKTIGQLCRQRHGRLGSIPAPGAATARDRRPDPDRRQHRHRSSWASRSTTGTSTSAAARTAKAVAEHYVGLFVATPPPALEGNPLLKQVQVVDRGDRVAVMVKSAGILTEHSGDGSYHYFEALTDSEPDRAEQYVQVIFGGVDGRTSYAADKDYWPCRPHRQRHHPAAPESQAHACAADPALHRRPGRDPQELRLGARHQLLDLPGWAGDAGRCPGMPAGARAALCGLAVPAGRAVAQPSSSCSAASPGLTPATCWC
ncbi:MAG: hypothetical protein V9H69_18375 [Anaerolineae bacterium]